MLFVAYDDANRGEVWVTDGTTAGTSLLKDVISVYSSYYDMIVPNILIGPILERGTGTYFRRWTDNYCGSWYRTDGTTEGTISTQDLGFGLDFERLSDRWPTAELGNKTLFFSPDKLESRMEMWATDFTPTGTKRISDNLTLYTINPGYGLYVAGDYAYFISKTTQYKYWLCRSDGTLAGTTMVAAVSTPFSGGITDGCQSAGNSLYFAGTDSTYGTELWKAGGTTAGAGMVKDLFPGVGSGLIEIMSDESMAGAPFLYFVGDDGIHGSALWRSDGTEAGTVTIDGIQSGTGRYSVYPVGRQASTCYFSDRFSVWRTDGTAAEKLLSNPASVLHIMMGTTLLFVDSLGQLFKIDNPSAAPVQLTAFTGDLSSHFPQDLVIVGAQLFFWTPSGLWKTDGTMAGTVMVKTVGPPVWKIASGNTLYFWVGDRLWKSDGTDQGTVAIEDNCPQTGAVIAPNPRILGTLGSTVLLSAADAGGKRRLWKTDETVDGTAPVTDSVAIYEKESSHQGPDTAVMGGYLYFGTVLPDGSAELWRSDGTAQGTRRAATLGQYALLGMNSVGSTLFLSGNSVSGNNKALWKSDGTAAGTVKVKDVAALQLSPVGSMMYFNAPNLWKTDGTLQGTTSVSTWCGFQCTAIGPYVCFVGTRDLGPVIHGRQLQYDLGVFNPATNTSGPLMEVIAGAFDSTTLPVLNGCAFFGAYKPDHGYELWKTDGTPGNAVLVKEITPGPGGSFPVQTSWAVMGNELYFNAADSAHGVELWKTGGTAASTVLVKDIHQATVMTRGTDCPDPSGSAPHALHTCGNAVYFAAADDMTGTELWVTRGTENTTVRLADIAQGPGSSNPANFTEAGDSLIFTATDGTDRGTELWAIALPPRTPVNPGAVVLGKDAILWTWEDLSPTEDAFKLWADAGTGAPTILRATLPANTTSWRQDGLSANTAYSFQVASTGEYGDSQPSATFTAWTSVPEPTGLHFSQVTKNSIQVTVDPVPANITQGQSGLYFVNQTRGLNSGWVQTASGWGCTGLSPNTPYTFIGRARNGAGVETGPAVGAKYTQAATPSAPAVDNPGVHTLDVSGIRGAGNPSYTLYAVQLAPAVGGNAWVQADGTLGGEAFFQTAGAWGALTVTGLAENTAYAFSAVARNGEGVDSEPGATGTGTTLDITPPTALITLDDPNPLNADAVRFGVRFDEPVGASLSPARITLAGTLAGTVAVSGTDPDFTVTVTLDDPNLDGTVGIVIGAGVADLSGNAYAGGSSGLYTLTHWAGFTQQPVGARRYRSESHLLQVAVNTGGLPTTYQWKRLKADGAVLNGPATAQWQLSVLGTADPGNYWCEVTNGGVTHPSEMVSLSVRSHLRIVHQPRSGEAFFGGAWAFSVDADGGYPPLHYQWRKEQQQDCPGATEEVYLIDPLQPEDAGLYSVEIHDSNTDALESYPVRLTLTQRIPAAGGAALAAMAALLAMAGAGRVGNKVRKRRS
jgi:ELWxxDGT repeat protein